MSGFGSLQAEAAQKRSVPVAQWWFKFKPLCPDLVVTDRHFENVIFSDSSSVKYLYDLIQ